MEYILIVVFQIIGIGLHVTQKIIKLGNDNTEKTRKEIISIFWNQDWDTLLASAIIVMLNLASHYTVEEYAPKNIIEYEYYKLISFGIALVLGYGGQRIVYNYLGKAENFLNKQVDNKLKV